MLADVCTLAQELKADRCITVHVCIDYFTSLLRWCTLWLEQCLLIWLDVLMETKIWYMRLSMILDLVLHWRLPKHCSLWGNASQNVLAPIAPACCKVVGPPSASILVDISGRNMDTLKTCKFYSGIHFSQIRCFSTTMLLHQLISYGDYYHHIIWYRGFFVNDCQLYFLLCSKEFQES